MEERTVEDEYGRGIRLRKTADGYVDVTDELAKDADGDYEDVEEIAFEYPVLETDEDDEDLVALSPEEAAKLRREKEAAEEKRKADYAQACKEGDVLLESGSFKAAELKFEKALNLDEEATDACVGYWRAKTADFTQPDVLIEEYAEAGIESLEFDLGIAAVDKIKGKYGEVFRRRVRELEEEEKPLLADVEEKQAKRREVLSKRLKRSTLVFCIAAIPTVALLVLTLVFGMKNFTTLGDEYITPTIVLAVAFFVCFIAFILVTNKWINDFRIRRANERLASTEEGRRLLKIRSYKELYECLLPTNAEE